MKRNVIPIILAAAAMVVAPAAVARSGHANPGGQSASHMSSQGLANSNGPNAADRDKGLERAEDRRSSQGQAHQKATTHATKRHGKKAAAAPGATWPRASS
jgi:hypothetical protein